MKNFFLSFLTVLFRAITLPALNEFPKTGMLPFYPNVFTDNV